ncbi:anti-sigma regulatory factor [Chromatium okenii]|nr:anti-sigma regulatory factor [Chromatium okenii]
MDVAVNAEADIQAACRAARQLAETLEFSRTAAYHIATAASELAANLLFHGGGGWLHAHALFDPQTQEVLGLEVLALDHGPGIADIALALTEGYSTGKGLGCGLPGVKRLMDEFMIESTVGDGTCVKAIKWR